MQHARSLRHRRLVHAPLVVTATILAVLWPAPSFASYPGPNGPVSLRGVFDGHSQLFTADPNNGWQLNQLTHLTDADVTSAAHWSPDMSTLTFEVDPANPTPTDFCNVALLPATGGTPTLLPLANGDQCEAAPTFSADGSRIIYEGFNGKHRDALFSMTLDGTDRRQITACQGRGVTSPEAAPDGKMLAFTCTSRDGSALFTSTVNGSQLRQLTPYSMQVGFHEDWSPDSRRIMFITSVDEGTPQAQVNTWTIGADGTGLVQLTFNPAGGDRAYGNSFSPDGRFIVLRVETGDQTGSFQSALFTMPASGGTMTQVTDFSSFRPRGMVWGSHS